MSPLAFDKQGKPFTWHAQTAKLRVRVFRTPSSRGTCSQVLDGAGNPLFVDANIEYPEFCRVVGKVPGLYRFDQCDEDGVEIKDAPPGYMSIENLRNAGASNEDTHDGQVSALAVIDRLMATQERLVATQAEVMKQMASQHAAMLAAGAEVMRAPYRAAPPPAAELRNADASDESDAEDDDDNDGGATRRDQPVEPDAAHAGASPPAARRVPVPEVRRVRAAQAERARRDAPRGDAHPDARAGRGDRRDDGAADRRRAGGRRRGFEAEDVSEAGEVELDASQIANSAPVPPVTPSAPATESATTITSATATAMPPVPTPEQLAHLCTIRERLSPKERAIAENAMARMEPAMLTHWLTELSAMSVEEATKTIRTMVAQLATPRGKDRR